MNLHLLHFVRQYLYGVALALAPVVLAAFATTLSLPASAGQPDAQIALLAQAAQVSPQQMVQRLRQAGVPIQSHHESVYALLQGDAQRHAQVIAQVLQAPASPAPAVR